MKERVLPVSSPRSQPFDSSSIKVNNHDSTLGSPDSPPSSPEHPVNQSPKRMPPGASVASASPKIDIKVQSHVHVELSFQLQQELHNIIDQSDMPTT